MTGGIGDCRSNLPGAVRAAVAARAAVRSRAERLLAELPDRQGRALIVSPMPRCSTSHAADGATPRRLQWLLDQALRRSREIAGTTRDGLGKSAGNRIFTDGQLSSDPVGASVSKVRPIIHTQMQRLTALIPQFPAIFPFIPRQPELDSRLHRTNVPSRIPLRGATGRAARAAGRERCVSGGAASCSRGRGPVAAVHSGYQRTGLFARAATRAASSCRRVPQCRRAEPSDGRILCLAKHRPLELPDRLRPRRAPPSFEAQLDREEDARRRGAATSTATLRAAQLCGFVRSAVRRQRPLRAARSPAPSSASIDDGAVLPGRRARSSRCGTRPSSMRWTTGWEAAQAACRKLAGRSRARGSASDAARPAHVPVLLDEVIAALAPAAGRRDRRRDLRRGRLHPRAARCRARPSTPSTAIPMRSPPGSNWPETQRRPAAAGSPSAPLLRNGRRARPRRGSRGSTGS